MMKRQRVNDGVEQPITALHPPGSKPLSKAKEEVGLPAELWSHVLQYAYFDEILTCTAVNKFFHDEVPPNLKVLHVRSGESMDVAPAAVAIFSRVQRVHIYLISDLTHGITKWHLDCVAIQNAVPFLLNLPKLELCSLGHYLPEKLFDRNYNVKRERDYDEPNSNEKWASLIRAVCNAYKTGKLSRNVQFDGLIPYNDTAYSACAWKSISTIDSYRDDVPCQICDMICTSFPPLQVLERSNEFIPCISFKNMCRIVKCRDLNQAPKIMMDAFLNEVEDEQGGCFMCPPDYVTKACDALLYYDHHIARMRECIANGANPKDPAVLKFMLDKKRVERLNYYDPNPQTRFIGRKRIIELETYNNLKELGFDVGRDHFITVDQSDKRTSCKHFEARKVFNQLSSGVAIGDIESVRRRVKHMVDPFGLGGSVRGVPVDLDYVIITLEKWLERDISKYRDGIHSLVRECQQARDNHS